VEEEFQVLQELSGKDLGSTAKERFFWARLVSFSRTFTVSRMLLSFDLTMTGGPRQRLPDADIVQVLESMPDKPTRDDVKETSIFVPLADMINHRRGKLVNCHWEYKSEKGFVVTAKRDLLRGEELFITYGNKGNDIFFLHYGFAELGNPHDAIDVILPFPLSGEHWNADAVESEAADVATDASAGGESPLMQLRIDGNKPSNVKGLRIIFDASHAAVRNQSQPELIADEERLEYLSLALLLEIFEHESQNYNHESGCPSVCESFRTSRQALIVTWRRFLQVALSFIEGTWPPPGAPLPERFELHARLHFGIWMTVIGKEFAPSREVMTEAAAYGAVSFLDLYDFDSIEDVG